MHKHTVRDLSIVPSPREIFDILATRTNISKSLLYFLVFQ